MIVKLTPTAGVSVHADLAGNDADDHLQYHTDARGDARYYQQTQFIAVSAGAGDAGKPIVLDAGGQVDASMINSADIDHSLLQNLGVDTHSQYLLLAGRSGGQTAYGGTVAGNELKLRGTSNANLGLVRCQAPIVFDDILAAYSLSPYFVAGTPSQSINAASFLGGGISISPTIDYSSATSFVWNGLVVSPSITSDSSVGEHAGLHSNPLLIAGDSVGHNPISAVGHLHTPTFWSDQSSSREASSVGLRAHPLVKSTTSSTAISMVTQAAVEFAPRYSTTTGSTSGLGTCIGLHCLPPTKGVGETDTGTETMGAYYGVYATNIADTLGASEIAAVKSELLSGSNRWCIRHTGTAPSAFGGSVFLGNGSTFDVELFRNGTNLLQLGNGDTLRINNAALRFQGSPSAMIVTDTADQDLIIDPQGAGMAYMKGGSKVDSTDAFYFGDEATAGSWRIRRSGNDLVFERYESSSWIEKGAFTAT